MQRRHLLASALAAGGAHSAHAQGSTPWAPQRPVEIIVPYAAGGPTDRYARAFGIRLSELWRQSVVISSRPGGAAAIGTAVVANAAGDGHTLLLASFGIVTNQILLRNLPYDPRAIAPLCRVALGGGIFFVHPSVPATNARELQAWARANPGALKFGSSGIGSTPHISAELFASRAGIEIVHIPYRGTAPALTDLLAGHINAMVDSATSISHAREGRIRAIATATPERLRNAPEVPTMRESGFDVVARTWYGFFAPTATPEALRMQIAADIRSIALNPEVQAMFTEDMLEPQAETPEQFRTFLDSELALWTQVIRERNISL